MITRDLELSAKFAYFLNRQGMLDALVIAFQTFREQQNFPFEIKEKRIATQAVFKGLCELYASRGFDEKKLTTSKDILAEANVVVEDIWNNGKGKMWEKRPETESGKMVKEKIEEEKEKIVKEEKKIEKDKKVYTIDIKGNGETVDFHAECSANSKTEAYEVMLKEYPGLGKSAKSAVIKIIKLKK